MKYTAFFILFLLAHSAFTQTVQVPENCLSRVSPCLIHTNDSSYSFNYDGQQVTLQKEAILKISFDEQRSRFEVLDGRISLKKKAKNLKVIWVNGVSVKAGWHLVSRNTGRLSLLDMNSFVLSTFEANGNAAFKPVSSEFIDKNEFIGFTKFYFQNMTEYNAFLSSQSVNWKREFQKQNNNQTKVLLRTLASEREKARLEGLKKTARASESKKVRDLFFYRTFER